MAAMTGVLTDPGPSASVEAVVGTSVTLNFYAWVDQRETDFGKARSEAIRLVKLALEKADLTSSATVYQVKLLTEEALAAEADAPAPVAAVNPQAVAQAQGDVSPSTELDEQLTQERARQADQDMLNAPAGQPG